MLGSFPLIGPITLGIYAVLLGAGGLVGYLKAGSRPSLIAGSVSAILALIALWLSMSYKNWGVALGLILSISLFILFGYRYAVKTRKFMPSGLLAIASLVVLAVMVSDHGLDAGLTTPEPSPRVPTWSLPLYRRSYGPESPITAGSWPRPSGHGRPSACGRPVSIRCPASRWR